MYGEVSLREQQGPGFPVSALRIRVCSICMSYTLVSGSAPHLKSTTASFGVISYPLRRNSERAGAFVTPFNLNQILKDRVSSQ